MKPRTLLALVALLSFASVPVTAADASNPAAVTTKKTAIVLDSGSVSLPKGTKVEVLGRDGEYLVVRFRAAHGKMLLADTDFNPTTPLKEIAPAPAKPTASEKPATTAAAAAPTPSAPAAASAKPTPPALTTNPGDQQPTTNYGKAVQKAKLAEKAHRDNLSDPTNEVVDAKK